jgi:hypothetical protein
MTVTAKPAVEPWVVPQPQRKKYKADQQLQYIGWTFKLAKSAEKYSQGQQKDKNCQHYSYH